MLFVCRQLKFTIERVNLALRLFECFSLTCSRLLLLAELLFKQTEFFVTQSQFLFGVFDRGVSRCKLGANVVQLALGSLKSFAIDNNSGLLLSDFLFERSLLIIALSNFCLE